MGLTEPFERVLAALASPRLYRRVNRSSATSRWTKVSAAASAKTAPTPRPPIDTGSGGGLHPAERLEPPEPLRDGAAGAAELERCTAGAQQCAGPVLQRCAPRRRRLDNVDVCASEALCDPKATAAPLQSAKRTNIAARVRRSRCEPRAYRLEQGGRCATAAHCNASMAACSAAPCTPGQTAVQRKRSARSAVQTDWAGALRTPARPRPLRRSRGTLQTAACAAGAFRCAGTCSRNAEAAATAGNKRASAIRARSAMRPGGTCKDPVCKPSTFNCTGAQLGICNADLTGFTPVGQPCATPPTATRRRDMQTRTVCRRPAPVREQRAEALQRESDGVGRNRSMRNSRALQRRCREVRSTGVQAERLSLQRRGARSLRRPGKSAGPSSIHAARPRIATPRRSSATPWFVPTASINAVAPSFPCVMRPAPVGAESARATLPHSATPRANAAPRRFVPRTTTSVPARTCCAATAPGLGSRHSPRARAHRCAAPREGSVTNAPSGKSVVRARSSRPVTRPAAAG